MNPTVKGVLLGLGVIFGIVGLIAIDCTGAYLITKYLGGDYEANTMVTSAGLLFVALCIGGGVVHAREQAERVQQEALRCEAAQKKRAEQEALKNEIQADIREIIRLSEIQSRANGPKSEGLN